MKGSKLLVCKSVADKRSNTVIVCAEASQLDLLRIRDFLGVAVAPFHGHFRVRIGVDKNIECVFSIQDGEESDRGDYLTEDSLDLFLYLLF